MEISNQKDINKARREIEVFKKTNPSSKIAILSQDDEFNRKALEIKGLNTLILNEDLEIKDYSKQRNSGLNEVLVKIASKKNISIGIDLGRIQKKSDKEMARALARLKQNIMLCKKAKCKIIFLDNLQEKNFKSSIKSLMIILGSSTSQAEEAFK
jgi:RNase P/RNase MRP subunit p30